jgi:hypothetical protein
MRRDFSRGSFDRVLSFMGINCDALLFGRTLPVVPQELSSFRDISVVRLVPKPSGAWGKCSRYALSGATTPNLPDARQN